eukprot:2715187-Alexandrium_andersonii.AAC.1
MSRNGSAEAARAITICFQQRQVRRSRSTAGAAANIHPQRELRTELSCGERGSDSRAAAGAAVGTIRSRSY